MYGPAPTRSKKTSFLRSRRGCELCRARKRKCDEAKPSCHRCKQAGQECKYETPSLHFRDASIWAAVKSRRARSSSEMTFAIGPTSSGEARDFVCSPRRRPDDRLLRIQDNRVHQEALFLEACSVERFRPCPLEDDKTQESFSSPNMKRVRTLASPKNFSAVMRQPQNSVCSADQLYLNHFATYVVYILPPPLRILCRMMEGAAITNHAAMALGAANLATLSKAGLDLPLFCRDSKAAHKVNALHHVSAALSLSRTSETVDLATVIVVQLLLSFVQAEIGDLTTFESYIRSIEGFLGTQAIRYSEELIFDTTALRPLAHPVHLRDSRLRGLTAFQRSLDQNVTDDLDSVHFRFIASDAIELNFRIALLTAMKMNSENPSMALRIMIRRYRLLGSHTVEDENITNSMPQIIAQLQNAYLNLQQLAVSIKNRKPSLAFASIVSNMDQTKSRPSYNPNPFDADAPIRFQTHDQAMAAADYVFARALCEESVLFINPGPKSMESLSTKWLGLFLRIAAGLDVVRCATKNKYRRGIVNMLFCANLFFNNVRITSLLLDLIARMVNTGAKREDIQTPLQVINVITQVTTLYQSCSARVCLTSMEPSDQSTDSTAFNQTISIRRRKPVLSPRVRAITSGSMDRPTELGKLIFNPNTPSRIQRKGSCSM